MNARCHYALNTGEADDTHLDISYFSLFWEILDRDFQIFGAGSEYSGAQDTNLGVWPAAKDFQTSVFYKSHPTASAGQK